MPKPGETSVAAGSRTWSLSRRLIVWYAFSCFGLVAAIVAFLYWTLTRDVRAEADHELRDRVQVLGWLLKQRQTASAELRWEVESEWERLEEPEIYVRILDPQLRPVAATPRMTQLVPLDLFPVAAPLGAPLRTFRAVSASGRAFRVASAEVSGREPGERWILHVAYDLDRNVATLRAYGYLLAAVLGLAAMLSLALGFRITRSGLRPMAEIARTTQRIRGSTLSERVPVAGLPSELAGLAGDFNRMLERLEESFVRLSRFSADMAHQLRSPLNILRGEAEVALSRPRRAEEYRDVLASSLEECARLSGIIDNLLFIAQAEGAEIPLRRERVDVTEDLRGILDFYGPATAEKSLTATLQPTEPVWASLDRALFRRAVAHLVANAITHTPSGGSICLSASHQGSSFRLEVSDTGAGIAPEHLPYVFDRFYGGERTQPRRPAGAGLGLSIVKTVMDLHGGSASITSSPGAGARVALVFPQPESA